MSESPNTVEPLIISIESNNLLNRRIGFKINKLISKKINETKNFDPIMLSGETESKSINENSSISFMVRELNKIILICFIFLCMVHAVMIVLKNTSDNTSATASITKNELKTLGREIGNRIKHKSPQITPNIILMLSIFPEINLTET